MLLLGVSKPEASASCINAWQQAQEMVWCTSKGFSCQWVNDVPLDATWNWWDWRATRKRNDEKCLQWHQRKQGTIRNTRSKKTGLQALKSFGANLWHLLNYVQHRFNIVQQWQVWAQDLWTGARGHRSCNTLAPQAWPSGRECHPNCNDLSTEGK